MSSDTSASHEANDSIQPEVPPTSEPEPPTSDSTEYPTFDVEAIETRYPEFRGLTMEEFEDILLDEDDPRYDAAKKLAGDVLKPMNDMVTRTMASVVDGKLDGVLSPFRKQMSELAASVMPKIDTGSILKTIGADRATQSYLRAIIDKIPKNSAFAASSIAAARQAAEISEHLKSLSTVKIPNLSDSIILPDYSSAIRYPDIATGLKIPKSLSPTEHFANISRPEVFRTPKVTPEAPRRNSVESWIESVGEFVEEENLELSALESIASFLGKIDKRDEAEAEQRKKDSSDARDREKNMTLLTWASVIMVGLTLLITAFSVWLNIQTPPVSTEQPAPTITSEPTPIPGPAAVQPPTNAPPAEPPAP